jgi:hypothetical protein
VRRAKVGRGGDGEQEQKVLCSCRRGTRRYRWPAGEAQGTCLDFGSRQMLQARARVMLMSKMFRRGGLVERYPRHSCRLLIAFHASRSKLHIGCAEIGQPWRVSSRLVQRHRKSSRRVITIHPDTDRPVSLDMAVKEKNLGPGIRLGAILQCGRWHQLRDMHPATGAIYWFVVCSASPIAHVQTDPRLTPWIRQVQHPRCWPGAKENDGAIFPTRRCF